MSIKRPLLPALLLVVIWQKPMAAIPPAGKKLRVKPQNSSSSTKSLLTTITRSPLLFCRNNDIWEVRKGAFRRLIRNAHDPAWSNKKDKIAFVRRGNVWICDSAGRYQRPITSFKLTKQQLKYNNHNRDLDGINGGAIRSVSWDPTGNIVAFSRIDKYTITRDVPDSMSSPFFNDLNTNTTRMISDIYACLPYTARGPMTFVWISASTSGLPKFSVPYSAIPAFCPTGKCVAFARNGDLWLAYDATLTANKRFKYGALAGTGTWDWGEERLDPAAIYDGGVGLAYSSTFINHITWSPNGKSIAYSVTGFVEAGFPDITYLFNLSTHKRVQFSDNGDYPSISPDGLFIAYNGYYRASNGRFGGSSGIVCKSINGRVRFVITGNGCDPSW